MSNNTKEKDLIDRVARRMYEQFSAADYEYTWFEYKRIMSRSHVTNEYLQIAKELVEVVKKELIK